MRSTQLFCRTTTFIFSALFFLSAPAIHCMDFEGQFFHGNGDKEYLEYLDISRRMFAPDPEFQNMAMLYNPNWNGFVEGPTWGAWWIQNSYGTTFSALPYFEEPYLTFLKNAHDLWFSQMGDGKRVGAKDWVAPDGCLCDAASPGWIMYKQGDGRIDIHDWGMEFTAAGLLLQAELLLIDRNPGDIAKYLPMLERCASFIETRRDPEKNLFLAGPAGNLLAPSYAGWKKPDGTYGQAYLTGLSVTYIAALDRLIEVEKLAGHPDKAALWSTRRESAKNGLAALMTDEGYFIKSLDPDGTRHGVYGAEKHGYFEASPNHDAIAFRVVDQAQAGKIYAKIASIPGLRPHNLILPNCPGYDDMYEEPTSWLWQFGTWVNGGHWSTCEARMILAYCRLGHFEDARKSIQQMMTFARRFRLGNPLTEFGNAVYQPKEKVNLCYDSFGPFTALIRGLFEPVYSAEGLRLYPHIPPGITEVEQRFPLRLEKKRLYLSAIGTGPVTLVRMNGENLSRFDQESVFLPYEIIPDRAVITVYLGGAERSSPVEQRIPDIAKQDGVIIPTMVQLEGLPNDLASKLNKLQWFQAKLADAGLAGCYEGTHAEAVLKCLRAYQDRQALNASGKTNGVEEESREAADQSYLDAASRLIQGLEKVLESYSTSEDLVKQKVLQTWRETQ